MMMMMTAPCHAPQAPLGRAPDGSHEDVQAPFVHISAGLQAGGRLAVGAG